MKKIRLTCGLTMGDPAGIGPEVMLKALSDKSIQRLADFVIIGNSSVIDKTAGLLKIRLKVNKIRGINYLSNTADRSIRLLEVGNISKLTFGHGDSSCGLVALECIREAVRLTELKKIDALITAPVNKHTINLTGRPFIGHTEYLASATKTSNFAMMLTGGPFKVVLVTRHIALGEVARVLTEEKIYRTICLTVSALKKYFGIRHPRIGVCSLNPHSGDEGLLGQEEIEIIRPAIKKAKDLASIKGPISADILFYSALHGGFDAIVAMYHDQGLIPLKTFAFHQGVNLTLGLPFVRTSPDHGTAYDIAGKNRANPASMIEAIKLAVKIASRLRIFNSSGQI